MYKLYLRRRFEDSVDRPLATRHIPGCFSSLRRGDDDWISFTNPRGINKTSISHHHRAACLRVYTLDARVFVCISGLPRCDIGGGAHGETIFIRTHALGPARLGSSFDPHPFRFTCWRRVMIPRGILHRSICFNPPETRRLRIQFRSNRGDASSGCFYFLHFR